MESKHINKQYYSDETKKITFDVLEHFLFIDDETRTLLSSFWGPTYYNVCSVAPLAAQLARDSAQFVVDFPEFCSSYDDIQTHFQEVLYSCYCPPSRQSVLRFWFVYDMTTEECHNLWRTMKFILDQYDNVERRDNALDNCVISMIYQTARALNLMDDNGLIDPKHLPILRQSPDIIACMQGLLYEERRWWMNHLRLKLLQYLGGLSTNSWGASFDACHSFPVIFVNWKRYENAKYHDDMVLSFSRCSELLLFASDKVHPALFQRQQVLKTEKYGYIIANYVRGEWRVSSHDYLIQNYVFDDTYAHYSLLVHRFTLQVCKILVTMRNRSIPISLAKLILQFLNLKKNLFSEEVIRSFADKNMVAEQNQTNQFIKQQYCDLRAFCDLINFSN